MFPLEPHFIFSRTPRSLTAPKMLYAWVSVAAGACVACSRLRRRCYWNCKQRQVPLTLLLMPEEEVIGWEEIPKSMEMDGDGTKHIFLSMV